MIAWAELAGKLIDLLLSKVVGAQLVNRLDKKKSAVKAFLGLYDSLLVLENATRMFIAETKTFSDSSKRRLFRVPLMKVVEETDRGSRLFFESLRDLRPAIYIYDSELAKLLWGVESFKFMLLEGLAHEFDSVTRFDLVPNPDSVFFIEFSSPSSEDVGAELDQLYKSVVEWNELYESTAEWNEQLKPVPFSLSPREVSWKADTLRARFRNLAKDEKIADNDAKTLVALARRLEGHVRLLSNARNQLAYFIRENFKIDDLLTTEI